MQIASFLKQKGLSRRNISSLRRDLGLIKLNGEAVFSNAIVRSGDIVTINLPEKPPAKIGLLSTKLLNVIYEDDFVIAANKQAGVTTIPNGNCPHLAGMILSHVQNQYAFMPLSRIDKNTTGIVLVAKSPYIQNSLLGQIYKSYIAVVEGKIKKKAGLIELPIGVDSENPCKRCVSENGRPSITKYKVLYQNENYSIVSAELLSGRTHQIRVHFSAIGHPLVGDKLYGASPTNEIDRQALHAYKVKFKNPINKYVINITAPLPDDMKNLSVVKESKLFL